MKLFKTFALLILAMPAFAGVNLKNGNFYVNYTDIIVPGGGQDLEITRTYNSKSTENGWFGFGWGSNYETYLSVSPDGSVIIHENGAGALTRFVPKTAIDPVVASKKIVSEMRAKSTITDAQAKDYIDRFSKDAELRQAYASKYGVTAELAAGTTLYSNVRGLQVLKVEKDAYVREYNSGKKEVFSTAGLLRKIELKNGYAVDFKYRTDGTLEQIKDSQAKQLFFEWYPNKKIKKIWSTGEKAAGYKFDNDDLVESTDVGENTYKYTYDNNHNLQSVAYSDNTKMVINYEDKTQFVSRVTSRNGEVTEYVYGSNPKNPDMHYWTDVIKKRPNEKDAVRRYEYEIKTKSDGEQYTYRIKTVLNDVTTETVYNEDSLPLKITRGKAVTNFKYKDGLLTEKTSSNGEIYKIEYDPQFNKISKVTDNKGWTNFAYDNKGNLAKAESSLGQSVLLVYDRKGRISKMVDSNKDSKRNRVLSFKYNAMDKPVEIEMENVGKINVAYDNYGEIKKVESKARQKMALQVTQAFQSLLSIVKPAGVNLNL